MKLQVEGFMPLSFEYLSEVKTSYGMGKLYSLMHTYVQNGDLMRDPEMCFIVVGQHGQEELLIFPQMYRLDSLGIFEESIHIINDEVKTVLPTWQHAHTGFANIWMLNIREQGFIK